MKNFKKKELSEVLQRIIATYKSLNEFAKISNVSPAYLSKLINYKISNAPTSIILKKIADNSNGIVNFMDLMTICGYVDETYINGSHSYVSVKDGYTINDITPEEIQVIESVLKTIRQNRNK